MRIEGRTRGKIAMRLAATASLLALAACGGGGGGAASGGGGGSMTSSTVTTGSTSPSSLDILSGPVPGHGGPLVGAVAGGQTFATSPASPILFNFESDNIQLTAQTLGSAQPVDNPTLTWTGNQTVNGQTEGVFQLSIPLLHDNVQVITDGSTVTAANGDQIKFAAASLNYTLVGIWTAQLADNSRIYVGTGIAGFESLTGGTPTSGTATYIGNGTNGGTVGLVYAPSTDGTRVDTAALQGQVSISANFSSGALSGSLTNMTVTPASGTAVPWNSVTLSGTLSPLGTVAGTTGTSDAPGGQFDMATTATGQFSGNFYGPSAQEVGVVWTLRDPPNGSNGTAKFAAGALAATKQ